MDRRGIPCRRQVNGVGAGPGAGRRWCRSGLLTGQLGLELLREAGVAGRGRRGEGRVRAVGDPGKRRGEAGRRRDASRQLRF